jgi:P-type E1-E2 ATPase
VEEREIDSLLIQPSDTLKVLPGTKIPADGIVTWGSSYVNESMVTGESIPVSKEINASVIGGTINLHGVLHIKATKVGSDTVLSQIINLVETAQMSKAPIQKFADYVSIVAVLLDGFYVLLLLNDSVSIFCALPTLIVLGKTQVPHRIDKTLEKSIERVGNAHLTNRFCKDELGPKF